MTLQNGLIHNRTAYLWTDTAFYDPATLAIIGHGDKAFHGTDWPWIGTASGTFPSNQPMMVPQAIADARPKGPKSLLEATSAAVRDAFLRGFSTRILLAVPCPDHGARMFMVASDELPFANPFQPCETVQYMCTGNGDVGAPCDPETPAQMRQFIDWQATLSGETIDGLSGLTIAGNLVEVELSRRGIRSRVFANQFLDRANLAQL